MACCNGCGYLGQAVIQNPDGSYSITVDATGALPDIQYPDLSLIPLATTAGNLSPTAPNITVQGPAETSSSLWWLLAIAGVIWLMNHNLSR
jgi:hypothetical protein